MLGIIWQCYDDGYRVSMAYVSPVVSLQMDEPLGRMAGAWLCLLFF